MKELFKSDVFKDTTSSIKSVVKSGAKGAAIWAKFQTIITLLISMVIYSVIIWLSFKYIVNVDYLQLEGTVVSCDCEDKPYTTTTKDSKTGDTNTSTGTTTTCTTTFKVKVPDVYKSQGLLVVKYINNNNSSNSSLRSLNNINDDGTQNVFIQNSMEYTKDDKVTLYFVDSKPLDLNPYTWYTPKSVGYVIISLMIIILLSHIFWTYMIFTNDTLATVVGSVEIYDILT